MNEQQLKKEFARIAQIGNTWSWEKQLDVFNASKRNRELFEIAKKFAQY